MRTLKDKLHTFRVTQVEERAFHGLARNGRTYRVPYASLDSMQAQRKEWTLREGGITFMDRWDRRAC